MAHFAPGGGGVLAVEVELGAGVAEDGGPVWAGGLAGPYVAKEVDHGGGGVLAGIAQGLAGDGAELLLELVGDAGVDGVVAAVVGAGGYFVDEDFALGGDEHFYGDGADVVEAVGDGFPEGEGLLLDVWGDAGGGEGDVEDVMGVDVLDYAVGDGAAVCAACADDGDFCGEGDPLLDDGGLAGEGRPGGGEVCVWVDFDLAFAVVTEGGGFDDAGAAELADGGFEAGEVVDDAEVCAGDGVFLEEELLALAVLGGVDGAAAGAEGLLGFYDLEAGVWDVLELGGDDVDLIKEALEGGGVVVAGGVDFDVCELACGGAGGFIGEDDDAVAGAPCLHGEHASELAAAEDADGGEGWEGGHGWGLVAWVRGGSKFQVWADIGGRIGRFSLMMRYAFLLLGMAAVCSAADTARPNMVFILCDDLGYGDVRCLNEAGKIATPHLDAMARGGMIFSDAHSSSAVCSPTRYGVMTGRYNWRTKLQQHVLGGLSPRLIEPGRMTVASMLKGAGYQTACVGKWHLGMDWVKLPGKDVSELSIETADQVNNVDYAQRITNGPTAVGFDSYFGISASLDMVPYTFIANDHVTMNPTANMKLVMNGLSPNGFTREGPAAPGFTGESVLPTLTKEAIKVIQASGGKPFFLYLPLNAPHTPILPTAEWVGKSGISLYADFVMQTDDAIGQVLKALSDKGVAENTLVVVTSDNGCSTQANFPQLAEHGHNPSYHFRGNKADIFDGGHRVPYIVQWPAVVKPGSRFDHLIGLWDFMATAAEIVGEKLPDDAGEDSVSFLEALRGQTDKPIRDHLVSHSINGSFAIREGNWKLCLCPDSGGWSEPKPGNAKGKGKKAAQNLPPVQLYDLSKDIGEKVNVQAEHPEIVKRLTERLEKLVKDGRSTPGAPQKNTVEPNIWRYSRS